MVSFCYFQTCCYNPVDIDYDSQWRDNWNSWQWAWSWKILGSLIQHPFAEAGGLVNFDPISASPIVLDNEQARLDCCINSPNCQVYHQIRIIDTCDKFVSPALVSKCRIYI